MNMFTWMVFIAVALVLASLVTGVAAMVKDRAVGHFESAQWMTWRVAFQALAAVLVLLALNAPK